MLSTNRSPQQWEKESALHLADDVVSLTVAFTLPAFLPVHPQNPQTFGCELGVTNLPFKLSYS